MEAPKPPGEVSTDAYLKFLREHPNDTSIFATMQNGGLVASSLFDKHNTGIFIKQEGVNIFYALTQLILHGNCKFKDPKKEVEIYRALIESNAIEHSKKTQLKFRLGELLVVQRRLKEAQKVYETIFGDTRLNATTQAEATLLYVQAGLKINCRCAEELDDTLEVLAAIKMLTTKEQFGEVVESFRDTKPGLGKCKCYSPLRDMCQKLIADNSLPSRIRANAAYQIGMYYRYRSTAKPALRKVEAKKSFLTAISLDPTPRMMGPALLELGGLSKEVLDFEGAKTHYEKMIDHPEMPNHFKTQARAKLIPVLERLGSKHRLVKHCKILIADPNAPKSAVLTAKLALGKVLLKDNPLEAHALLTTVSKEGGGKAKEEADKLLKSMGPQLLQVLISE